MKPMTEAAVARGYPYPSIEPERYRGQCALHGSDRDSRRPGQPIALYDWLTRIAPNRRVAWDATSGGGLLAEELAGRFDRVLASDMNADRMRDAPRHPRIKQMVTRAENPGIAPGSIDLIAVSQGAHMLDMPAFSVEAARVARPPGLLAIWAYGLPRVDPDVDAEVGRLYNGKLGPYWPPERNLVDSGYRELHFPFKELEAPDFEVVEHWTVGRFVEYLMTWPAYGRYKDVKGGDPMAEFAPSLSKAWGDAERAVRWPIHLRVGVPNP